MVAILAAIFNMAAKTHKKFRSALITKKIDIEGFLEECDRDQYDCKMAVNLAAIKF